jgi:hypothetical protein
MKACEKPEQPVPIPLKPHIELLLRFPFYLPAFLCARMMCGENKKAGFLILPYKQEH